MSENSLFGRVTAAAEERQLLQNTLTAYEVSQGDCSGDRRMPRPRNLPRVHVSLAAFISF